MNTEIRDLMIEDDQYDADTMLRREELTWEAGETVARQVTQRIEEVHSPFFCVESASDEPWPMLAYARY